MTRQRWFCCLCGNLTKREPRPDGRALCSAHMTVALDAVPPDPLESLPVTAQEMTGTHRSWCAMLWTSTPGRYCNCGAALRREDSSPASGTDG